jgi:hypothetical protein
MEDVKDYKNRMRKVRAKKESFGSQKVEVSDYIISPKGLESLAMVFYFLLLPYLAGVLFLYIVIAHATFEKFLTFDLASLFVVWMIGYEVIAVLLLIIILYSYLNYVKRTIIKK